MLSCGTCVVPNAGKPAKVIVIVIIVSIMPLLLLLLLLVVISIIMTMMRLSIIHCPGWVSDPFAKPSAPLVARRAQKRLCTR